MLLVLVLEYYNQDYSLQVVLRALSVSVMAFLQAFPWANPSYNQFMVPQSASGISPVPVTPLLRILASSTRHKDPYRRLFRCQELELAPVQRTHTPTPMDQRYYNRPMVLRS